MQIDLQTTLRKNRPAPREEALWDIRQIKIALNRLGYYMPEKEEGFDDDYDMDFDRALRAFQWAKRVPRDDSVGPGSLTERVLNEELAGFNDRRFYIWRTVGDEKVRGSHAARNGKVFQWAKPPEGGHPGEDHNCRCWAEPVAPIYHPWIQHLEDVRAGRAEPHPLLDSGHFLNNINTLMASQIEPSAIDQNSAEQTLYPDAINPAVSPIELLGGGLVIKSAARFLAGRLSISLRDSNWTLGSKKSITKWKNQMRDRGWTEQKITETIRKGKKHPAPNAVNKDNLAIRYEYKGNYLVRDEKTKEIIHLGAKHFKRRLK